MAEPRGWAACAAMLEAPGMQADSASAATLGLLNRHRQARELLQRSGSTGSLSMAAAPGAEVPPGRPPRPQSATSYGATGSRNLARSSSSSASCGLRPEGATVGGRPKLVTLAGLAGVASPPPQRSPYSAGPRSALRRPSSAGATQARPRNVGQGAPRSPQWPLPRTAMIESPCPLSPLGGLQSSTVPAPLLPERSEVEAPRPAACATHTVTAAERGVPAAKSAQVSLAESFTEGESEADFTEEELLLERQIEQALNELEAIDAANAALQVQLENSQEDAEDSRRELSDLQGVVTSWERAAQEGRRELAERQRRVEELLRELPAPSTQQSATKAAAEAEAARSAEEEAAAEAVRRETRRIDLAEERAKVLEDQTARLKEQVAEHHFSMQAKLDERRRLDQQLEALTIERDTLRAQQRDARAAARAAEVNLKGREDAIAAGGLRRQALERQAVHLRSEANGLRVRLANVASLLATSSASDGATAQPSSPTRAGTQRAPTHSSASASNARATSLALQQEIVYLWGELKRSDLEEQTLVDNVKVDVGQHGDGTLSDGVQTKMRRRL